jgi:hypothetical protein
MRPVTSALSWRAVADAISLQPALRARMIVAQAALPPSADLRPAAAMAMAAASRWRLRPAP